MSTLADSLFADFQFNGALLLGAFDAVEVMFGCSLPEEYKSLMLSSNGGEGFVGEQYLILWRVDELIDYNLEYEATEYVPGLLLFGSSGGGEAFAFDTRSPQMDIVVVPFIGMSLNDVSVVAHNFNDFIIQISKPDGLFP